MFLPTHFSIPVAESHRIEPKEKEFYFSQTQYLSNSDLSVWEAKSKGKTLVRPPQKVFEFGTAFDEFVTNRSAFKTEKYLLSPSAFSQIEAMAITLYFNYRALFDDCTFQKEYYNDKLYTPAGIFKARCKVDVEVCKKGIKQIYDIKTTTCKTQAEFENKIKLYAYDRAAAWYSDTTDATHYSLLVCNYTNKKEELADFEHQIWKIDFTPQMLKIGREKYMSILNYIKSNK
jgi:hypothetical protein